MALFVFSLCPFDISVGVVAFVIGLSQISSFLSLPTDNVPALVCRDQVSIIRVVMYPNAPVGCSSDDKETYTGCRKAAGFCVLAC